MLSRNLYLKFILVCNLVVYDSCSAAVSCYKHICTGHTSIVITKFIKVCLSAICIVQIIGSHQFLSHQNINTPRRAIAAPQYKQRSYQSPISQHSQHTHSTLTAHSWQHHDICRSRSFRPDCQYNITPFIRE